MPTLQGHRPWGGLTAAAFAASLGLHAVLTVVIAAANKRAPDAETKQQQVIELAVVQRPEPPITDVPELPPPPLPDPPVLKRVVERKTRPVPAPPPPSSTPAEPEAPPPLPTVGLTPESVVDVPAATAAPMGNTVQSGVVATNTPAAQPAAYAGGVVGGTGATAFAPVAEGFVKEWPRTLNEVRAPYPDEARRLQVSGTVKLRVGIDETGKVREVKVIKRAGFGLDEAAAQAMWRFKFAPAIGQDGRAVPFRIHYDYTFTPGR